ncbi:hypothetical protein N7497_000544 [Penicillium chrysogenum]|nr:hypothetical protein N7497_000544 [Penicillium chrysogenum]
MLFDTRTVLAGVALVSQAFAAPLLEERASIDTSFWDPLRRAAQLSSAAYTGCTGTAFDITITKKLHDTLTDAQGYVGYSSEKKTIAVVMKGSTSMTDIINDISTNLVTPSFSGVDFPSGVKIMSGINRPWKAVHDDVISENFPEKQITSYALAAFPIGNDAWANFASSQAKGTMYRGNNIADGVPNMYVGLPLNFKHYGTEIYSSGLRATTRKCDGQRDRACSAGNGMYGVTAGHFQSFGVGMGVAGCRSIL